MKRTWISGGVLVALVGGAYFLGRARAAGVPAQSPMFYSGYLTDVSGKPASGTHGFVVKLYTDMTTTSPACTFTAAAAIDNGRFHLQLDDSCTAAVHANPDLYLELSVDTQPFPRSKLGAVPYALEAGNATTAQSVPYNGISGISNTTDWTGSVSPERVSNGTSNGWVRTPGSGEPLSVMGVYIQGSSGQQYWSTGDWIASVQQGVAGTGAWDITFKQPLNSSHICVASSNPPDIASVPMISPTGVTVYTVDRTTGAGKANSFFLICMGR
jgi:hypothetical protein